MEPHYVPCTTVVVTGTCCSSAFSNPTTEQSSERPGKVDRCLISSASKEGKFRPLTKANLPFLVLEIPSPGIAYAKDASRPVTMGWFCHSFPIRLTPDSHEVCCLDLLVTPETQAGSVPA